MDVLNLLTVLLRRWPILAAVLALTAGALALAASNAETIYELRGAYLVTTPGVAGTGPPAPVEPESPQASNPYENSQFSVRILEEAMGSAAVREDVEAAGGTGEFALEFDVNDPASVLYLTATGPSPEVAERTHEAAREEASAQLEQRQAPLQLSQARTVDLQALSVPASASSLPFQGNRTLITIALIGGLAAVGAALAYDNLATALRRRRAARPAEPAPTDADLSTPAPPRAGDDATTSVVLP